MNGMTRLTLSLVVVLVSGFICGCKPPTRGTMVPAPTITKDYYRQLPPGELALRKITDPAEIPDFTVACGNTAMLRQAINNSLHYMAKPSSQTFYPYGEITHEHAVNSLKAFGALLDQNLPPAQFNEEIRKQFDVYISVGCDDHGTVLFTGYYTPIFDASPTKTEKFKYPIYKSPPDLQKGPDGNPINKYPPRQGIEESNMFAGNELFWLCNPFEVYVLHVQGSGKLRMPDGKLLTVGYAANNGHEYKSIAMEMVNDGKIARENLSLRSMIAYFHEHPDEINEYTYRNPRFVFFRQMEGEPVGCLNEPVLPMRSIATDKSIYPRACMAFINAKLPRRLSNGSIIILPYTGFTLDQDRGDGIRAPGRCDVYMGTGDEAGDIAGQTKQEGTLYYLFLKPGAGAPAVMQPTSAPADAVPTDGTLSDKPAAATTTDFR